MDERKLEELFRDTVRTVPPATFDEQDVARRSHRITVRRRRAALGGSVAAVAVVAAGVGLGAQLFTAPSHQVASPPQVQRPTAAPMPHVLGGPATLDDRSAGCSVDPQLVSAVTAEFPEAAAARPKQPAQCPSGAKAAAFELSDGPSAGQVTVLVSPISAMSGQQAVPGDLRRPDGAQQSVRKARSGKLVVVISQPAATSPEPPFGAKLAALAGDLAGRF